MEAREGQEFDLYEVSELVEKTFLNGQANIARRYAPIMNILNQVVGDSKKAHHALNRRPMAKLFGAKGLKKGRGTGYVCRFPEEVDKPQQVTVLPP